MIDPAEFDIANRFLDALVRTDSMHAVRLSSLAEKLCISADTAERIASELQQMHRICRCDIQLNAGIDKSGKKRKAEAFSMIWIAGNIAALEPFNGNNHRHLFVKTGSEREALRAANGPRVRPAEATAQPRETDIERRRHHRTTREVRDIMNRAVQGRTIDQKISRQQLADILLPANANAISATSNTIGGWLACEEASWVAAIKIGRKTYYYDTRAAERPRHRSLFREAAESINSHRDN